MIVVGIDPGKKTGVATYIHGKLYEMHTINAHDLPDYLDDNIVDLLVFEDSRMQSVLFTGQQLSVGQRLKIARDVGGIDLQCGTIDRWALANGIRTIGVSPKGKGGKLDRREFRAKTGWTGGSNKHGRDAALVAFPFRHAQPEAKNLA